MKPRLLKTAIGLFLTLSVFPREAVAQTTSTQQPAQGSVTPQAPGGLQDAGVPVIIVEGQTITTATGAQTQVFSTILHRDPNDPEHATDPQTGRSFNWDSATNNWVNSQTGQSAHFAGYLCLTPPSTATTPSSAAPGATPQTGQGSVTPQAPGGPQDAGNPVVIVEGQTTATATGAQTQVFSTILHRDPNDPEHATDPQTGRSFNWDSATNSWVNSQTGQSAHFAGYLCLTPPSASSQPTPTPSTTQTAPQPTPPSKPSSSSSQTSMGTTGAGIQFQLRGFGGATIINGNTPSTAGFDGAVLFPLGNRVLVGPTAGFQWVDSSIVKTIGGGPPPSTFINESVGFKSGNFGGRIGFPFGGWQIGVQGGATVASSKITQNTGFCGGTSPTAPPTCTVTSSTTTHDTVVGPFVGGYISHSIFSHVGVFVGYDYHLLSDTKSSVSVFDLHYSDAVAGFNFTFGRH